MLLSESKHSSTTFIKLGRSVKPVARLSQWRSQCPSRQVGIEHCRTIQMRVTTLTFIVLFAAHCPRHLPSTSVSSSSSRPDHDQPSLPPRQSVPNAWVTCLRTARCTKSPQMGTLVLDRAGGHSGDAVDGSRRRRVLRKTEVHRLRQSPHRALHGRQRVIRKRDTGSRSEMAVLRGDCPMTRPESGNTRRTFPRVSILVSPAVRRYARAQGLSGTGSFLDLQDKAIVA